MVGEAGAFAYRGEQAHDGYYSMTYHPKSGRAADADRRGKSMIVTGGDRITLTGTAEAIYYCTLGGGIYDDPALSELLYVADSLGRIRSGYSENVRAAFARGDQAEGRRWNELFNRFYADDPGAGTQTCIERELSERAPAGDALSARRPDSHGGLPAVGRVARILRGAVRGVEVELLRRCVRRLPATDGEPRRRAPAPDSRS